MHQRYAEGGDALKDSVRRKMLAEVEHRAAPILKQHSRLESACKRERECDDVIDVLLYIVERLNADNAWLVDRLAELGNSGGGGGGDHAMFDSKEFQDLLSESTNSQ